MSSSRGTGGSSLRPRSAAGGAASANLRQGRTWKTGVEPPATWRVVASLLLAVAGLGVSIYETLAHFENFSLVCPDSGGAITCKRVTTSPESYIFHIPVAVLGLVFFVAMIALCSPMAWRAADRRLHLARLALSVVGLCFVLYLVAAELLIIGSICLWCTSVHVITFLLFVLVLTTVPAMLGWGAPVQSEAGGWTDDWTDDRSAKAKRPTRTRKDQDRQFQQN